MNDKYSKWLAGAALCAAALGAQAQQGDDSVTIPAPRLKIELPAKQYHMTVADLNEFRGAYQLSNGQILRLRGIGTVLYGEIDDQGEHRMVAASRNTFVALDRKLQVRIDREQYGEPGGEVLMAVPVRSAETGEIGEHVVRLAAR
ncbi:hypothetical protein FHW83_002350 [Duganella sp. SG902]|uniref:hypothetical protein n=1 Tax=Duganella sp. SG902 TaxID=2587016 RepID=UPI00159E423F|nr:hypothetical protein [Duganella sp. SG902]NVM76555.1 hypothetical protein [Duganella sp. SG902]